MENQFIYFADKEIEKHIGKLKKNTIYPFVSNGKWAMHDLLIFMLKKTGKAEVFVSTFSISEIALRAINNAVKNGVINSLQCLFDYSIKKNKLNLIYFAKQITSEIYLNANHSKIILIKNKNWKITIIGTANMTTNPKIEAGVIFTEVNIFNEYEKLMKEIITKSRKYDIE